MNESSVPDIATVASPPRQSLTYEDLQVSDDPIGAGGQAVVYEAIVTGSGEPSKVALKEPQYSGTLTAKTSEAFLQEASTWQNINRREQEKPRWNNYEHIVGVIDTGETNLPWIAMEYMDGGDLADRLDNAPNGLPVDEALWICECLCRGVEIAHEIGIAHLDIKPANVLFRQSAEGTWDVPKIADWGVARVLAEETGTMDAMSIEYAAPEQFKPKEYGDPDSLSDQYQIGAVLYATLTGEPPYTGSNANIMSEVLLGDGPTPPSCIRDELSDSIDAVVTTAMSHQKNNRYRNIAELEQALKSLRTGEEGAVISDQSTTPVSDENKTTSEDRQQSKSKSKDNENQSNDFNEKDSPFDVSKDWKHINPNQSHFDACPECDSEPVWFGKLNGSRHLKCESCESEWKKEDNEEKEKKGKWIFTYTKTVTNTGWREIRGPNEGKFQSRSDWREQI